MTGVAISQELNNERGKNEKLSETLAVVIFLVNKLRAVYQVNNMSASINHQKIRKSTNSFFLGFFPSLVFLY